MNISNLKSAQTLVTPNTRKGSNIRIWQILGIIVWAIGFIILIISSVIVHAHPGPWPFDLQTTVDVQSLHIWSWVIACLTFINVFNNGIPAAVELALWF